MAWFGAIYLVTDGAVIGTPKGEMSWPKYSLFMLREIGGKGKTADVANAAIKANALNPSLPIKRIRSSIGESLSRMGAAGVIKVMKISKSLKDGNIYEIIDNKPTDETSE